MLHLEYSTPIITMTLIVIITLWPPRWWLRKRGHVQIVHVHVEPH